MFDTFRGLLICCIPLSHFTRVAGGFHADSLSGIIYITINVFVMQAFVFLSGYFSKKPERARETAFHTFLWPYLLCIPFFYVVRLVILGNAEIHLNVPPFALWYLFALFFYRFFLKDYIKVPYILEISLIVYLFAGQASFLSSEWALGRMVSYFPFFLLGYYCTPEHLAKIRSLSKAWCAVLAAVLVTISCLLAYLADTPAGFYLLKCPASELGMGWIRDIVFRAIVFVLACAWIVLMLNILPNKKSYLSYIGMNTMPLYILHLIVRYEIKKRGIFLGILPENPVLYYILIFAFVAACIFVFTSKPVCKGYDFVVEGSYKVVLWCLDKVKLALSYVHIPFFWTVNVIINLIEKTKPALPERSSEEEEAAEKIDELDEKDAEADKGVKGAGAEAIKKMKLPSFKRKKEKESQEYYQAIGRRNQRTWETFKNYDTSEFNSPEGRVGANAPVDDITAQDAFDNHVVRDTGYKPQQPDKDYAEADGTDFGGYKMNYFGEADQSADAGSRSGEGAEGPENYPQRDETPEADSKADSEE